MTLLSIINISYKHFIDKVLENWWISFLSNRSQKFNRILENSLKFVERENLRDIKNYVFLN